jgi:hypothetical protein
VTNLQHSAQTREENASQGASAAEFTSLPEELNSCFRIPRTQNSCVPTNHACVCYTHDYLFLSPYIFYMPPLKLFSTARSYSLSMIKFFLHHRIFYPYNFTIHTYASPILCSKSLHLHLYFFNFLRFTFLHIQMDFYFLFSGLSNTTLFSQA